MYNSLVCYLHLLQFYNDSASSHLFYAILYLWYCFYNLASTQTSDGTMANLHDDNEEKAFSDQIQSLEAS